jgi:hypothetical protein
MKFRLTAILLFIYGTFSVLAHAETITGVWILEGGKSKNRFEVEFVAAKEPAAGYWLVNTEGSSLIYEGRYVLKDNRLVRVEGGVKLYDGIAFRLEGDRWVWAGDRKNQNLNAYIGANLRRPKPMSADAQFNEIGQSRLYIAALDKNKDEILRLLKTGTKIDTANTGNYKRTALYAAIDMGHIDIVNLLLEQGANVNYQDARGTTPLMAAGETCGPYPTLVRVLLAKGADERLKNKKGLNATEILQKAGGTGFIPILEKEIAARKKL